MKNIHVINYPIKGLCNYHCRYCFSNFRDSEPSKETALKIVEKISKFFIKSGVEHGRINLAGGEPLLYPYLNEVIDHANSLGLKVSIITNGSHLTEELVSNWQGKVEMIGISIDAASCETNCAIGRTTHCGESLNQEKLFHIADWIHKYGIKLKINTVISRLNLHEDTLSIYKRMKPNRLKFLCMHVLDNINSRVNKLKPSKEEFEYFVNRNRYEGADEIVVEAENSMQNAYLMISPSGNVFLNESGESKIYGNCLEQDLYDLSGELPFDNDKYRSRYCENGEEEQ